MSLIRKPADLEIPQNLKALIYGQAGMGKTTLALSAPKPLLLDFDNGVHRVNFGHQTDTVQIHNWREALSILKEDLTMYETIVVDTIGKMMDYIILDVTNGGIPQIKDWNKINMEFTNFTRSISGMGKNVIYVAHRDVRKEGDDNVFIPALREKNYSAIVTELDLMGYLEVTDRGRIITFNPTKRNEGKNTCNLPAVMSITTTVDQTGKALPNNYLSKYVIAQYKANLQERNNVTKAYEKVIEELKNNILLITDALSANDFIRKIDKFGHVGNSKAIASNLLAIKARELGLKLNAEKVYEDAPVSDKIVKPEKSLL